MPPSGCWRNWTGNGETWGKLTAGRCHVAQRQPDSTPSILLRPLTGPPPARFHPLGQPRPPGSSRFGLWLSASLGAPILAQLTLAGPGAKGRGVFLAEGRSLRGRPQGSPTPRHRQGQGCAQCQGSVLGLEPEGLKAAFVERGLWPRKAGPAASRAEGRVSA